MNEQNNINQNPQQGNNGVISPSNLNNTSQQATTPQAQPVVQSVPGASIDPLPVPNVVQDVNVQTVATTQPTPNVVPNVSQPVPQPPIQQEQMGQEVAPPQPVTSQPVGIQEAPGVGQQISNPAVIPQPQQTVMPQPTINNQSTPINMNQQMTTPTTNQDIVPQAPINPITNNIPNNSPTPNVMGPSVPIASGTDATQVGFVAASKEMPKKRNKPLIIAIIVGVLVGLGLLGYFVIYPLIIKIFFSDPINVYETSINYFYKGISSTASEIVHSKAIYDVDVTLDSNIEAVKQFANHSYRLNFGVDPDKQLLQMGYAIKNNETNSEYSYFDYIKNGKRYINYSNFRGYIYTGEIDVEETSSIFASYKDIFDNATKLDSADVDYIVNKLSELTKASIQEDKLSKEDTTITINNETIKVTNNKYVVDKNNLKEMFKSIIDGLKSDDKSIEIISKYMDMESNDVKDMLDSLNKQDSEDNNLTYTFNIYTYGNKNEIIGFGLTTSDESIDLHYYSKDNYFELDANTVYDNEETGKIDEDSLLIVGHSDGSKTSISVKVNDNEILTLVVSSWTKEKKEISYNLKYEEYKINGKFSADYDLNDERVKCNLVFDANTGDEYIKVTLNISEDWTSDVSNINTDNAVTLSDEELALKQQEFMEGLMNTPLGVFFSTTNGEYSPGIGEYYGDDFNNDNGDSSIGEGENIGDQYSTT